MDIVLAGGRINLLYPFIKLGSVQDYMSKHKLTYLKEQQLMACAISLLKALQALHEEGFVHGQLRTSKILVTEKSPNGQIKVALRDIHGCSRSS